MNILIFNKQKDLELSIPKIKKMITEFAKFENIACDEVSVNFIGTTAMQKLHFAYFEDASPTDCISFPMDGSERDPFTEEYKILGEVFVCPHIALEYSGANNTDPYRETMLYVVHGLLHLLGYDDISDRDRKKMRKAEKLHMENLENQGLTIKKNRRNQS